MQVYDRDIEGCNHFGDLFIFDRCDCDCDCGIFSEREAKLDV